MKTQKDNNHYYRKMAYCDNIDLILQLSHILTNRILVSKLGFNVGDPNEQASHAIVAEFIALFHCLLEVRKIKNRKM